MLLSALGHRQLREGNVDAALEAYRKANEVLTTPYRMNDLAWTLATGRSDDPASLGEAVE